MDWSEAKENLGCMVLAYDEYYGTYLGELQSIFNTHIKQRAKVRIISCLEQPSQWAIIFTEKQVRREPYRYKDIINFNLSSVTKVEGMAEGMSLEDILKKLVATALEARMKQQVQISTEEWEEAKAETLRDIYANKMCFFGTAEPDYFINAMATYLHIKKRIAA